MSTEETMDAGALRAALEPCFAERTDCPHGTWDAVAGDHYGEHLTAALAAAREPVAPAEPGLESVRRDVLVPGSDPEHDFDGPDQFAALAQPPAPASEPDRA